MKSEKTSAYQDNFRCPSSTFLFKFWVERSRGGKGWLFQVWEEKAVKMTTEHVDSSPNVHPRTWLHTHRGSLESLVLPCSKGGRLGTEKGQRLWGRAAGSWQSLNPELLSNPRTHRRTHSNTVPWAGKERQHRAAFQIWRRTTGWLYSSTDFKGISCGIWDSEFESLCVHGIKNYQYNMYSIHTVHLSRQD